MIQNAQQMLNACLGPALKIIALKKKIVLQIIMVLQIVLEFLVHLIMIAPLGFVLAKYVHGDKIARARRKLQEKNAQEFSAPLIENVKVLCALADSVQRPMFVIQMQRLVEMPISAKMLNVH